MMGHLKYLPLFPCLVLLTQCHTVHKSGNEQSDYLVSFADSVQNMYGYQDTFGRAVIPLGKYAVCYTDTFRAFAIVSKQKAGLIAIDRAERVLYEVFPFDNGPDYPEEGLFRIIKSGKIGYADARTGLIVIPPSFACAFPFVDGRAKVSNECTVQTDGEHRSWSSSKWLYIDKQGQKIK